MTFFIFIKTNKELLFLKLSFKSHKAKLYDH